MSLHNRYAIEAPRNIFSLYDLDYYDYYDGDYDDYYDDYYGEYDFNEVFVITKDGVFITNSKNYYDKVQIDKDFEIQDVLREDYVLYDNIKSKVQNEYPEFFI